MENLETLQSLFALQVVRSSLWNFLLNLVLSAILGHFLARIYVRCGRSLSNRRDFGANLPLLAMTTMLIITIVQASLALSLGLIGALSIVRFRAAIKEPEELVYLFLAIAMGLGLGADQRLVTLSAFAVICGLIVWRRGNATARPGWSAGLYLTVTSGRPDSLALEPLREILGHHCRRATVQRVDTGRDLIEASFLVEPKDDGALQAIDDEMRRLDESVQLVFLDHAVGDL